MESGLTAKAIFATLGTALVFLFGALDTMLIVLISFIVIDYISGVISAAIAGQLSSAVGFKGILKKVLIFIVVAMAVMVDRLIGQPIIRTIVIMFYIANEGLSILENLGECGVPYPAKLKAIIASLNNESSTREE